MYTLSITRKVLIINNTLVIINCNPAYYIAIFFIGHKFENIFYNDAKPIFIIFVYIFSPWNWNVTHNYTHRDDSSLNIIIIYAFVCNVT